MIRKVKSLFDRVDPESVSAYRTVLPDVVDVSLARDGNLIVAKITKVGNRKIKGLLITQAEDFDEVVTNVNDLVYEYIDMPNNIRPYYGDVFQPETRNKNAKRVSLVKA